MSHEPSPRKGATSGGVACALVRPSVVALVFALAAPPVWAGEPAPPAPAPRPAPTNAVARIAEQLAADLAGEGPVLVVSTPLGTADALPRAAALTALLATQVAGRLGGGARPFAAPLALAGARDAARGFRAFVVLSPVLEAGKLRVTADRYPVPASVWAAARDPEPGPVAHAFAEAPLDAELRSYLPPIPLVVSSVSRARAFESDVLALACGDLGGDGASEIVTVGRRRVSLVRVRGGRVVAELSRPWSELAPVHPTPLREPIGFATWVGEGSAVDVGLTDRARSIRLSSNEWTPSELPGLAVPTPLGSACLPRVGSHLGGALGRCAKDDAAPQPERLPDGVDALAAASLVGADGAPLAVWATRSSAGEVTLTDGSGRTAKLSGVGAQLALGDLDQDGEPELLAGLDVAADKDAVLITTWRRASGRLEERARIPAAAGVQALAVCPPDGLGQAPFVVATADELWVVR